MGKAEGKRPLGIHRRRWEDNIKMGVKDLGFEFVLLRSMWPHVYVICACLVLLSVGDLLVNILLVLNVEVSVF